MTLTPKEFSTQTVDATGETIYTGTAGDIIKEIWLCNVTALDATIELWRVDNGGGNTDQNKRLNGVTVPANQMTKIDVWWPLDVNGDFIYAKCGTIDAICVSLNGVSKT